ncbi:DUF6406 domain-containing protein [Solicola sp. PLA-1-18]|uniref:DUF6406 domain-containing protein n=1 Tax=Solicola sp. PLA-1-18 TaxID=3380532 RepID=UPI003B77DC3D
MTSDPSASLHLRQGVPTRVELDGHRCRLGIATTARDEGLVTISVLVDGVDERFRVGVGDGVRALDARWTVGDLDMSTPGRTRVRLDPVDA